MASSSYICSNFGRLAGGLLIESLVMKREHLCREDRIVKDAISRNIEEIGRASVPTRILVRELEWEEEHRGAAGTESPEAFENLGELWRLLKECSSLFQEDKGLEEELGNSEQARKIKELRRTVARELNRAYELLTTPLRGDRIVERIAGAHRAANKISGGAIAELAAELEALRK